MKNREGIDMAVLIEQVKNTLNESKEQEMSQSLQDLRRLGEEIIMEHPDAFSDDNLEKVIEQARSYIKYL